MGYSLNVSIPEELLEFLKKEGAKRGLSLSALGREAIMEKYAEALEQWKQRQAHNGVQVNSNKNRQ